MRGPLSERLPPITADPASSSSDPRYLTEPPASEKEPIPPAVPVVPEGEEGLPMAVAQTGPTFFVTSNVPKFTTVQIDVSKNSNSSGRTMHDDVEEETKPTEEEAGEVKGQAP